MPEIIETLVYTLDELEDRAREGARDWYRQTALDDDWHDVVFEDFEAVCDILGVSLATRPVRLMGGGTRTAPRIWFSGFSSQGDGACFEGAYHYAGQSRRRIRDYAPKDVALHGIANRLAAVQRRNFFRLEASVGHRGRYYHDYSMDISVGRDGPTGEGVSGADEEIVIEALRDLARWLYRRLEAEYDYQTGDAQIDEVIRANGYTFTEAGRRFG
jgi:hypothetical protein